MKGNTPRDNVDPSRREAYRNRKPLDVIFTGSGSAANVAARTWPGPQAVGGNAADVQVGGRRDRQW